MYFLYHFILLLASAAVKILALFSPKMKLFADGRKTVFSTLSEKIQPGDKTMVDALLPAMAALKAGVADGKGCVGAMEDAVAAAEQAMKDTIPLQARKGRASYLGERIIGHQDPGATSSYLILNALLTALKE